MALASSPQECLADPVLSSREGKMAKNRVRFPCSDEPNGARFYARSDAKLPYVESLRALAVRSRVSALGAQRSRIARSPRQWIHRACGEIAQASERTMPETILGDMFPAMGTWRRVRLCRPARCVRAHAVCCPHAAYSQPGDVLWPSQRRLVGSGCLPARVRP